ncbi:glycosyltransferase family 25 protein [Mycolicibacterium frederiksbergense]|uniref:glycosyltransferase family 25 protein n=1 Tax=Mycolicibacterium frederiksbergense TaxID=117567 RepID=UPI00265B8E8E|nr:glycosyltransferase family 25 protein [Mycolicibacterium frederiksbergense]MDO0972832.1 glycosyltransferase family 25 protein [Mycolicibacterium frederiksbergense]
MQHDAESVAGSAAEDICPIPAFIIGLPATYRGDALEAQLNALNVSWSRVDGVVFKKESGDAGLVDQMAAKVLLRRELIGSEIGCALAHRNVYRTIIELDQPYALVFEDDARIVGESLEYSLIEAMLHTEVPTVVMLSYKKETAVTFCGPPAIYRIGPQFFRAIVPPTTTTAYALNAAAAGLLLDAGQPISHVADWPVRASASVHFYLPRQTIAVPDPNAGSTIGDRGALVAGAQTKFRLNRFTRRLRAALHVTWLQHRGYYGSYGSYVLHEFIRMPMYTRAAAASEAYTGRDRSSLFEGGRLVNLVARLWK